MFISSQWFVIKVWDSLVGTFNELFGVWMNTDIANITIM